jgi:hypothetical protein
VLSQVDEYVKNSPAYAIYELRQIVGRQLKMHSPKYTDLRRRIIFLDRFKIQAKEFEVVVVVCLDEITPLVEEQVVSVKFRTFGDRQCRRKVLSFGLGYAAGGVPGAGTKIYESI